LLQPVLQLTHALPPTDPDERVTTSGRRSRVANGGVLCVSFFLSSPLCLHQHNLSTAAHTHHIPVLSSTITTGHKTCTTNTKHHPSQHTHAPRTTHIMLGAPIFIKSKEEALPDVKNWYAGTPLPAC
jgi:hypothetical protein